MPIKPHERQTLRNEGLKSLLIRKIDQKIIDSENDEVVFKFHGDTPWLVTQEVATEYAGNGWVVDLNICAELDDAYNPTGLRTHILTLRPDDGVPDESEVDVVDQLEFCTRWLTGMGMTEAAWELGRPNDSECTARVKAIVFEHRTPHVRSRVTIDVESEAEIPEAAVLIASSELTQTVQTLVAKAADMEKWAGGKTP